MVSQYFRIAAGFHEIGPIYIFLNLLKIKIQSVFSLNNENDNFHEGEVILLSEITYLDSGIVRPAN